MASTGSDAVSTPAQRFPTEPRADLGDLSLDLIRHALHCVQEALNSVEQAVHTLSLRGGGSNGRAVADAGSDADGDSGHEHWLTGQERRVLTLVTAGLSNREIAGALQISEKTTKNYVHTVLVKLDVSSRTEAAFTALYERLVDPDECRRASKRTAPMPDLVLRQRNRPAS